MNNYCWYCSFWGSLAQQWCHLQKYFLTPGIWGSFPSSRVVIFCKFICKTAHRRFSVKPGMDVFINFLIIVVNVIPGATTWDTNSQVLTHSVWPSLPLILKQEHSRTCCQDSFIYEIILLSSRFNHKLCVFALPSPSSVVYPPSNRPHPWGCPQMEPHLIAGYFSYPDRRSKIGPWSPPVQLLRVLGFLC